MKNQAYVTLAANEEQGWYYEARRRAVASLIERFILDKRQQEEPLQILDVGCGTGGTSAALRQFGAVTGLEPSPLARELLHGRHPNLPVLAGGVDDLDALVARNSIDLATIMGVLYSRHVRDPGAALECVQRTLRPGGYVIWNEAAYPFLHRQHDDFVETARRFYPSQMRSLLAQNGFEVLDGSHLLGWAFPVAAALSALFRLRCRVWGAPPQEEEQPSTDDHPLPRWLNGLLMQLTYAEWRVGQATIKCPLGVSYLVMARKVVGTPAPQPHFAATDRATTVARQALDR